MIRALPMYVFVAVVALALMWQVTLIVTSVASDIASLVG